MWMVEPKMMCRKHLLGEHVELHMLASNIEAGRELDGYIVRGLVEIDRIPERHEELVIEMTKRGYKHSSPLFFDTWMAQQYMVGKVDDVENRKELMKRCDECKKRVEGVSS